MGQVDAGDIGEDRSGPGGHHHCVRGNRLQQRQGHLLIQIHLHIKKTELIGKVPTQGSHLLPPRGDRGQGQLPAQFGIAVVKKHLMAPPGGRHGGHHPCRTAADHQDLFLFLRPDNRGFLFPAGPGIDQTGDRAEFKHFVEAALVAGDAMLDGLEISPPGLVGQVGIGNQAPGHSDQVRLTLAQYLISHQGVIHPVAGHHRDLYLFLTPWAR